MIRLRPRAGPAMIEASNHWKEGVENLVRVDYHGNKEVPTGTCQAILKAADLKREKK
jgi:hypothetical protein